MGQRRVLAARSRYSGGTPGGGGGSSFFQNLPVGWTVLQDNPWDDFPVKFDHTYFNWNDDATPNTPTPNFSIVDPASDGYPAAPVSPSNVIKAAYLANTGLGGAPFHLYCPFTSSFTKLYVGFAFLFSSNFFTDPRTIGYKWMWPAADIVDGGHTYFGWDGPDGDFSFHQQGTPSRDISADPGHETAGKILRNLGTWRSFELRMEFSGALRVWVDDDLIITRDDMTYQTDGSTHWQSLSWFPTLGGVIPPHDSEPLGTTMWNYIDHMKIAGSN